MYFTHSSRFLVRKFNDRASLTFDSLSAIVIIFIVGFSLGFHILLSHKSEFEDPWDSLMKTLVMMSGEYEYSDIFFGDEGKVPFPTITYFLFVVFFFLMSIVTLNLLVGLTVDDIKEFLDEAEFKNLKLKVSPSNPNMNNYKLRNPFD